MHKYLLLICGLLLSSLTITTSYAQSALDPLLMEFEGSIWQWTESDGLEEVIALPSPIVSRSIAPNGQYLVYEQYTEQVLSGCFDDEGNQVGGCAGPDKFPTNIFVIDLESGETITIAGSSADVPENGRSRPIWSPDGTRLAWTEGYDVANLNVYDFASGTTSVIAEDIQTRFSMGVSSVVEIMTWIDAGIIFQRESQEQGSPNVQGGFMVYAPDGGGLLHDISPLDITIPATDFYPTFADRHYFANLDGTEGIFTDREYVDLNTGAINPTPNGIIARYAYGMQDTSVRVHPPILDDDGVYRTDIYSVDGELLLSLNRQLWIIHFSSSGEQIAYSTTDETIIWDSTNGRSIAFDRPEGSSLLGWGTRRGHMLQAGGETFIASSRCKGSNLPFRLSRNGVGHVLGDSANNVRSEPNASSALVGQVAPNVWFTVLAGPVCSDGLAWWQIGNPEEEFGWTVEGADAEYWIFPACPEFGCGVG